jgi:hypothetical protein
MIDIDFEITESQKNNEALRTRRVTAFGYTHYQSRVPNRWQEENSEQINVMGILVVDEVFQPVQSQRSLRSGKV